MPPMDEEKLISVTIIPVVTATLSIIGSLTIIVMLIRSDKKLASTYRRLLFGMSIMDIASSTAISFSSFASPKETSELWNPVGNTATCTAQGVVVYSGQIGLSMYNCSLCLYYTLSIVKNMKREEMLKVERFFHFIPAFWILSTVPFLLVTESFNAFDVFCMIESHPQGCDTDDNVDCTRGLNARSYRICFYLVPTALTFIIICWSVIALGLSVRGHEQKVQEYRANLCTLPESINAIRKTNPFSSSQSSESDEQELTAYVSKKSTPRESLDTRVRKEAYKQAIYYIFAIVLSHIFGLIFQGMRQLRGETIYILWVLQQLTMPTQGFFNFIVFLRPRVLSLRSLNPELSLMQSVRIAIKDNGVEADELTRSYRQKTSPEWTRQLYTAREWHLKTLGEKKNQEASSMSAFPCENSTLDCWEQ